MRDLREFEILTREVDASMRRLTAQIRKTDATLSKYPAPVVCKLYQATFDIVQDATGRQK